MPVLSVVLLFHRDTPYLRPAIASVLGQTLRDLELVLVDNGTGLSADALGAAGRDARLRWVRLPRNEGIPAGHNAGIAAATGPVIGLLDHDDVALPTRFERQVEKLQRESNLGLVSSLAETIDERGRVVGREFSLIEPAAQRAYSQFSAPVVTPAYSGRREIFLRFPYRGEFPYAADFDFLTRAAEAVPMAAVPEVLLHYRRHAAQTTRQQAAAIEDARGAIRLLAARRRAGRPEDLLSVTSRLGQVHTPADSCRGWSRHCLAERFPAIAAFHARRSFALERTPGSATLALGLALRAFRQAVGPERKFVRRLFLTGPVSALGLRAA